MSIVTLTTDFGTRDWFVGTMKGVLLGLAPHAAIVDLTHEIPAGNIRAGAFALAAGYRFFPRGTVHVAVVDPGVGSTRKALAVQTAQYLFVGPDNGVLSWALQSEKIIEIRALENETFLARSISRTFHGRDIFAPVAAHLAKGTPIARLGRRLKTFSRLEWPEPRKQGSHTTGQVIYFDHFGNAITNIGEANVAPRENQLPEVCAREGHWFPVKEFYQAVPIAHPVGILGSTGFLEIAVNGGSAKERLGLKIGSRIVLRRSN